MTVSSYTLNQLYANGIIDYVPDLGQVGIGMMGAMQNPYMNMAMQGAQFQNYGSGADSFSYSSPQSMNYNQTIGTNSNVSLKSALGFLGIGSNSTAGTNVWGQTGIGANSNVGFANSMGGFTDVSNSVKNAAATVNGFPNWVKGLGSVLILTLMFFGLKGKKKPKKQGFFARIFGGKKPEPPKKESFLSKINIFKGKNK